MDCFRKAVAADDANDTAWTNLGVELGRLADQATDPAEAVRHRTEAIDCYRKAVAVNNANDTAWSNLGVELGQLANQATDPAEAVRHRTEAIDCYRKAVAADDANDTAWSNIASLNIQNWYVTQQKDLLEHALAAANQAAAIGGSCYNLACILSLTNFVDDALTELTNCLANDKIEWAHVELDGDWDELRGHPCYLELKRKYGR